MSDDVAAIVEVTLVGTRPAVRRLILIPYSLRLDRFHSVLQLVMGWESQKAHLFVGVDLIAGDPNELFSPDANPEDESLLTAEDLLPFMGAEALYYYDFAKEWRHRLRLLDLHCDLELDAGPGAIILLEGAGRCPILEAPRPKARRGKGEGGPKSQTGNQKKSPGSKKKESITQARAVDFAAINLELIQLSNRWKRRRRRAKSLSLELILLDSGAIRADYLKDLQSIRNSVLVIEDELGRHESRDLPEFRRCVNLEFGARFSILRELHQGIDWLTARLTLVQKLMQHGVRPVGRAYFQALGIENGEAPYPDFPPERDEADPEMPLPEKTLDRETIRDFIAATGDEFLTEEEVESLTEDVLKEADKRNPIAECKSLYRKIVSLLHPDRAGEMTPERKDLWLRAQDAYADGDLLSLRSILDRCGPGTRQQYLTCSEIIEAIQEATVQLQAIEMFRDREAKEPSWDFCRLNEKKRKSRLRRVTKDLDEEENDLRTQLAELQRECESLEEKAKDWESRQGGATQQMDLFR